MRELNGRIASFEPAERMREIEPKPRVFAEARGMGRNRRHRYRSAKRRGYGRARRDEPALVEELVDCIIAVIGACGRLCVRLLRWMTSRRPVHAPSQPPLPQRIPALPTGPTLVSRSERQRRIESTLQRWAARPPDQPLPYCRAARIMTRGEKAFWNPLWRAVRGKYRIFCKVRLADVICAPPHLGREERRWFKKIRGYHVDFVIADPHTTAPLLVVELDDRRHQARERKACDDFKDDVLRAAGMPVLRVHAQQAYDPIELAETIERKIAAAAG